MMLSPDLPHATQAPLAEHQPLGTLHRGFSGHVFHILATEHSACLPADEMERRLIELGFVEGAKVTILHEGLFGRDPIAVRVNGTTVALRRREAMAILVS
ncbi:ferrous iron transport protein A [Rhodobacter aestuarii]|uniref:Ferrous iron transport protein A n=1 Tax=Rhodobacter aestuarii TaxID=453582 RepID=A0A1N7J4E6_9RHOB|nr:MULTISPECIES: ferrous iron transport protein A [Rhodobacter]PTV97203.1 ferrous iron transport protein A [Rhodobacter aestuarii]SIS44169.1 ferrous iron transport protein A [Rhodobacter aestuarii]SOB99077.1 ferrous iron transport protein A [Rhodobacter sp. JA431]